MNQYTRQEAIKLSGLNAGKLSYLDSLGLITPYKVGSVLKPTCLYSWEQILQLRTIARIKQDVSLRELRKTIKYLKASEQDGSLHEKILVTADNINYWIPNKPGEIEKLILKIIASNRGNSILLNTVLPMDDIVTDIWKLAEKNKISKFEERAKTRPKCLAAA